MAPPIRIWPLLREAASEWSADKAGRLGAALAYYAVFSLGPLLLIATAVAGAVLGEKAANDELAASMRRYVGEAGATAIGGLLKGAHRPGEGLIATWIGIGSLLFAATGVVIQLKDALNTVWDVDPKELPTGAGAFVRKYIASVAMILGVGFLLLVSFILTTVVSGVVKYASGWLPLPGIVLQAIDVSLSLVVVFAVFAATFKLLPDTEVPWSDVWAGAALTAILFQVGKVAIATYIGRQAFDSTYGAAGSFLALLLWMYYSAQILFFGAELTQVYARHHGSRWAHRGDAEHPVAVTPGRPAPGPPGTPRGA
ncbi:MAG: YihY/virulence factor BrkB family protein [Deltaproteobacteria bacterium]|nr:YihY/virulence factor BrkB family protein [Deltaproteobacteria bacterium]